MNTRKQKKNYGEPLVITWSKPCVVILQYVNQSAHTNPVDQLHVGPDVQIHHTHISTYNKYSHNECEPSSTSKGN